MNEKEIGELRRRLRPDKNAITHVRGCYVNENREIVSQFDQSLALLSQEESELLLSTVRRTLSGGVGKNLVNLEFETAQVVDSPEHRLLMALRDSALRDEEAVQTLFQTVLSSLTLEGSYLILLTHDRYDVPFRSRDGAEQPDASAEVYSYVLCSICPVKQTKLALGYSAHANAFHDLKPDWAVSPPELGFLFPSFDDRSTNLYGALYYARDLKENHPELVDAVFHRPLPPPAAVQKETFHAILGDTLAEDSSLGVVQAVHDQLRELIAEHKESGEAEPLTISKGAVKSMLKSCGVLESHIAAFDAKYDEAFGPEALLPPRNLVDARKTELRTPDVAIQVSPERSDLVQTRVLDGVKYILIRADEGVEVNGVPVRIS